MPDPEKTEQVVEPSAPSGITEQLERFKADQEANREKSSGEEAARSEETQKTETKEEPSTEEKPESEESTGKPGVVYYDSEGYFCDENGNRTPRTLKVDGMEREIDTLNKWDTHASFGYHTDIRGKELNDRESKIKPLEEHRPLIEGLIQAWQSGRLAIDGKVMSSDGSQTPAVEAEAATFDIDYDDLDPDTAKVVKAMESRTRKAEATIQTLTAQVQAVQDAYTKEKVTQFSSQLQATIKEAAQDFPLAMTADGSKARQEVWAILAEADSNGKAKYTPEEAARMVHQSRAKEFSAYAKSQGYDKVDDKKKQEIQKEFLSQEEADKAPPVRSPDSAPTSTTLKTAKPKPKDLRESLENFDRDHAGALTLARRS